MANIHPSFYWDAEDLYLQAIVFCEECTSFLNAHHHEYKEDRRIHIIMYWLGKIGREMKTYWPINDTSKPELDHIFECLKA